MSDKQLIHALDWCIGLLKGDMRNGVEAGKAIENFCDNWQCERDKLLDVSKK